MNELPNNPVTVIGEGTLYYAVQVKNIWAGAVQSGNSNECYSSMKLRYENSYLPKMLLIAKEMERQGRVPKVFIEDRLEPVEVVVVFSMLRLTTELMQSLTENTQATLHFGAVQRPEEMKLIAIAETEFSKNDLIPFFDILNEKRFFNLFLVSEEKDSAPAWGCRLTSFIRGYPSFQ